MAEEIELIICHKNIDENIDNIEKYLKDYMENQL
jgi:hypothetical protein